MLTRPDPISSARHSEELQLRADLVAEADKLGIDLSDACERGLERAIGVAKADRWYQENKESVDHWNRYVEEHGLPLASYRQF